MDHTNGRRVLAIAVDAAEPTFVRHLIDRDEMPALKSLLSSGKWLRVKSPAGVGSAVRMAHLHCRAKSERSRRLRRVVVGRVDDEP